ncbi:MAG: hypothetical protein GX316_11100 [Firmicutes bacterium]|nr:hypothetical protein [Bacillota bacterium]
MKNRTKLGLFLVLLFVMPLLLTGCGSREHEVTPQQFVYGYEEARKEAAARRPITVVERTIPPGTVFAVRLLDRLSSINSRVGDLFRIEVVEDVVVDGAVVIPVGSMGQGRITVAQKAGSLGRSGDIGFRFDVVRTFDNVQVAVEWEEAAKAQNKDVTFAEYLFLGVFAVFKKGDNIAIPSNTQFYVTTRAPVAVQGRVYR